MSNDLKLPRLLDSKQVAEMLRVPVWSLRQLARKKEGGASPSADWSEASIPGGRRGAMDRGANV